MHWLVYRGTHVIACGRPQNEFSPKLLSTEDKALVDCLSCRAIMRRTVGPVEQRQEVHPHLIEARDVPVPRTPKEKRVLDEAASMLSEQLEAQRKRWGFV